MGNEGEAWPALSRTLDLAAVALAAEQVGGAQRCLDMSVTYAKERVQFGRAIGSFSGDPRTRWISDSNGRDRDMELLEDFSYTDPDGRVWPAPAGSVVNGASIPSFLWSTVGSPYTDNYRNASVVHDVACEDSTVDRFEADQMFYYACLAGGCSVKEAKKLFIGVRFGAWMDDCQEAPHVPPGTPLF